MNEGFASYFVHRADAASFLLPIDIKRSITELFGNPDTVLPWPYKIFYADETQAPTFGFPVNESSTLKELDMKLDRWLADEVVWQVRKDNKDKVQQSFAAYMTHLTRLAENAMLSRLLADYHAVFWLAHSLDLSRQFATIPRRVGALDSQLGRTQGDVIKYRIFGKWATDTREQMTRMATRVAGILDGEEERSIQFFRILSENVLILTEEFVGQDLRELRSFVTGYLHRDFQAFRDAFERLRNAASELLRGDRAFRGAMTLFGFNVEAGITIGLLLDSRFQKFLFEHPTVENLLNREEREQFHSVSRRLREYAVLNQLRRGIVWMTLSEDGDVIPLDRRPGLIYSKNTRPIDFGRPGVVDPMIYRFGLMYDITSFSETLGDLARTGRKGEVNSYRQMLLFQRKLETIADRYRLQFEKFLGDGAFYTTRRPTRMVTAAIEIQGLYAEMKQKGFAFNRGVRLALNFGYYRLLPMKGASDSEERVMEFYGPGVVELSRLTTGKATREIEEIQGFLISHGYDTTAVQRFFAPLARGVDLIDHKMHQREFFAYVNSSGHLVNEGIVASLSLLQELSSELAADSNVLHRLRCSWGSYIGFSSTVDGIEFIGIRLIGTVSLKGLSKIEVGEIVPFARGETQSVPLDIHESLVTVLRQDYHSKGDPVVVERANADTEERIISSELVLCGTFDPDPSSEIVIGQWDPHSDEIRHSIRFVRSDLQDLIGWNPVLTPKDLEDQKKPLYELYARMSQRRASETFALADYRRSAEFVAFVLGDPVEQL